ncbi:MAG TPA: glycosyltransferase family 39 protein, partial [Acidimicrobiales bacterium]|nr:glycosyltransferase family 39 protein [Acidimicrobiales bacterium]
MEQPVAGRAPTWAHRGVLAALAAAAGVLYSWNAAGNLEIFYAAAVRSMSGSWHDFFFAAFDPKGTISIDKLPGSFWVQALSVRLFGVHPWALVAPQVVEGMATVLVVHRVAARTIGSGWALIAAALMVADPAVVALDRGNISDTLMILLLLLAANATVSAILSGRLRHLLLAGLWVGLAFQAKMIEAWLVLPALGLAYLVASSERRPVQTLRLALAGAVTVVVSLSWMTVVTLLPASSRPYVDGSSNNSLYSQVFVYNGFGRTDTATPNQILSRTIGLKLPTAPVAWDRLLSGPDGRVGAWLLPAAVVAIAATLVLDRDRRSVRYGATVMWGTWLVILFAAFTLGQSINSYYTAALIPPAALLIATGARLTWLHRHRPGARIGAGLATVATAAYALWLMPAHGVGRSLVFPLIALVVAVAGAALLYTAGRLQPVGLAGCLLAVSVVPLAASL